MATELLAVAATAANSSDFTVAAGVAVNVFLKAGSSRPIPVGARVFLEVKDSAGAYNPVGMLTDKESSQLIQGGATTTTYRLRREVGASVGAEQA